MAKINIQKHYSVVGILEDMPNFLVLLEYLFPQYFTGIGRTYKGKISQ